MFADKIKRMIALFGVFYALTVMSGCNLFKNDGSSSSQQGASNSSGVANQPVQPSGEVQLYQNIPDGGNGNLNIHFIDVGQGDCIIIEFPDNKTMLIDAGDRFNSVKAKIGEMTEQLEIDTFDYVLLTHADSDHVGSMGYVFDEFQVNYVFRPNVLSTHADAGALPDGINVGVTKENGGTPADSKVYLTFLSKLAEEECEWELVNKDSDFSGIYSTDEINLEYKFDFLTPVAEKSQVKYKNSANDYSPIATLTYNGVTVLFTGDAEEKAEGEFLAAYSGKYPDCDVIKVGHHGSDSSSSQSFINVVKPEYAFIQCGIDNKYEHPLQVTLDKYLNAKTDLYRNDTNGDIAISIPSEVGFVFGKGSIYCVNSDSSGNYIGQDVAAA